MVLEPNSHHIKDKRTPAPHFFARPPVPARCWALPLPGLSSKSGSTLDRPYKPGVCQLWPTGQPISPPVLEWPRGHAFYVFKWLGK